MTKTQVLDRAKGRLERLSEQRLHTADDILAYLEDLESDDATEELLRIPGLMEQLEEAERDIAEGRTVSVDVLQRKH